LIYTNKKKKIDEKGDSWQIEGKEASKNENKKRQMS